MLNDITIPDSHSMPNVQDTIEGFLGCSHFSCFDVQDAFWAVRLNQADQYKTAFATHNMLLEWLVIPQGCMNGAVFFARVIQQIFQDSPKTLSAFQDDVFAHTKTFNELLEAMDEACERMLSNNLVFKLSKTFMNESKIRILGQMVSKDKKEPDPKKIQAILDLRPPESHKELQRFIGLFGFQSQYIHRFSELMAPL